MVSERGSTAKIIRKPAEAAAAAVAPRLGNHTLGTLLTAAERIGIGSRASTLAVREAERRLASGDSRSPDVDLCHELLRRPRLPDGQRARLLAALGRAERRAGRADHAITCLSEALAARPLQLPWRVELLRAAVDAGEREAFYAHFNPQAQADLAPAELAGMLGQLGQKSRKAKQWQAAADAYHHAHRIEPAKKAWKDEYLRSRRFAPDWGFYSLDAGRVWRLADYPEASTRGLVAPIRQLVFGWMPASAADTRVFFKLNGTVVTETRAVEPVTLPDGRDYLQFSRYLKDLWTYAGAGDTLSVESNGHNLAIVGRGTTFPFRRKQSRATELLAKLEDGFVFNKYGRVNPSIQDDDGWRVGMSELYAKLRQDLHESLGLTLIPFYGTMLGAVREQDFIGHDNDFDTIYFSEHSEPAKVRQEFKDLCHFLLSRAYDLKVKATHTWVKVPGTPDKLDIFFGWFNADGYFDVSYGYHGTPVKKSPKFFELRTEKLGSLEIPAPTNAEAILGQLYGPGWRTPDPGFAHYSTSRKLDRRYHLRTAEVTELHWSQFYRDHQPHQASHFAEFVAERFNPGGTLVEFGCGGGRDGIYFANRGWTTFCCDRSPEAIGRADEVLQASGGLPARFDVVDVAAADDVQAFLTTHADSLDGAGPLVVYLRFFLHAIDESTQNMLLDTLTGTLDNAFYLCAEFRTLQDRDLAKAHGAHYRRYIDQEKFADQLRDRWHFEVEHVEAGQGLSPFDGEDPHLGRVVALRPSRTAD